MNPTDPIHSAYALALAAAKETGKARRAAPAKSRAEGCLDEAERLITEALRMISFAQQPASPKGLH